jgi:hypothetical protein
MPRRDSHEMREMQWVNGRRSFIGHARKLCADVDAGPPVFSLRQHRRSLDPSSSDDSAHSESQTAYDTSYKNSDSTSSSSVAGKRLALPKPHTGWLPACLGGRPIWGIVCAATSWCEPCLPQLRSSPASIEILKLLGFLSSTPTGNAR